FNAIRLAHPELFPEGKFVGRDSYAAVLAQQNMTIDDYESNMAREVLITRLKEVAVEGVVVTPAEIEQEFRRRNEKVNIAYVKLSPEKLKSEVKITPAEMKEYFARNPASFPIPEKKSLAILIIDQARLEQSIHPAEAELRRAYLNDQDRFRTPERVQARHILLKTTDKSVAELAKVKARAEDLLKQIKGGADFAELARKNSEDPGSAPKGGDLGWLVRGQTVKPFEDTAFSLKPKEISNVVNTEYGFHIIQVMDHHQPHLRTFDEVRAELVGEISKQRVSQMMQDLTDRAEAGLRKDPPEKVAKDLGLAPPIMVQDVAPGDPLPEIGVNKDFDQSLAGLKKGDVSQAVALTPTRNALAVVTNVNPTHPATFEEAQSRIRQALEQQKIVQLVTERADELVAKAKAINGDLEKAAKAMGLELKKPPAFDRRGAVEALGQATYIAEVFTKPDGAIVGP